MRGEHESGRGGEVMSGMKYRLLKDGERIQKGDESLDDDAETWNAVTWHWHSCTFSKGFFMPVRRPV